MSFVSIETLLNQLREAVAAVPDDPRFAGDATYHSLLPYELLRANAWRAAYQWRDGIGEPNRNCECKVCRLAVANLDEGMRLIEKLK